MKLAYVSWVYAPFAEEFAARAPGPEASHAAVRDAFAAEAFGWVGAWGPALAPLGHEVLEVWTNVAPLQRAWAREHGLAPDADETRIVLAQLAAFAPDVLWFDSHDARLLARIRAACPSIRAVLGWVGSALPDVSIWRAFDRVLSCAPESVAALEARGVRASHLHHAFQPRVLERLGARAPALGLTFLGQLAPGAAIHAHREALLEQLLGAVDVAVFAPAPPQRPAGGAEQLARSALFGVVSALRAAGVPQDELLRMPVLGRAAAWESPRRGALPPRLAAALQPGRFGMAFYRTLRDSRVTLNVHGGGAARQTSNMRLFEATGAGACLLTDAAVNLAELFEPEREVATFASPEECVEKARWLLAHDAEREAIALGGQRRCLASHTFAHRAPRLDAILREVVR